MKIKLQFVFCGKPATELQSVTHIISRLLSMIGAFFEKPYSHLLTEN